MTASVKYDFNEVLSYIESCAGITLPETNYRFVQSWLDEKLAEFSFDIREYFNFIETSSAEKNSFLDAVTINETYFFREQKHFVLLETEIIPELEKKVLGNLKIWSAACSTGEEAVSLAVTALPKWRNGRVEVFASDINPASLEALRTGRFSKRSVREDGNNFHTSLMPHLTEEGGVYVADEKIRSMIRVLQLNLADEQYELIPSDLHIVFLRNMLIYVKIEQRQKILDRIVSHMSPGGYLFLSSSEIPLLAHVELVLENKNGSYFFRKKDLHDKKEGIIPGPAASISHEPVKTENKNEPSPQPPEQSKPKINDILQQISLRLNNPLYEDRTSSAYLAALDYLETVYLLNSGELEKAGKIEAKLLDEWGENELTDYFRGITALQKNELDSALELFSASLKYNTRFWPAVYQRALIQKESDARSALRDFRNCLRLIDAYIIRDAFSYQFLLEGFNAKYFAEICRSWISKLELKGAENGTR